MPFILRPRDEAQVPLPARQISRVFFLADRISALQIRTLRWSRFKSEVRPQHVTNCASYTEFYQAMFRTCLCTPSWKFIPPY